MNKQLRLSRFLMAAAVSVVLLLTGHCGGTTPAVISDHGTPDAGASPGAARPDESIASLLHRQLTTPRVPKNIDLQPPGQKGATYVGSAPCRECHQKQYAQWKNSYHTKMIQPVATTPGAIVADFASLPVDADFEKSEVVFTIGGKFKQRYMLSAIRDNTQDYVIGNYQWNVELNRWQPYKPYKDWYTEAFPHNNKEVFTSRTCDGCHFVGFMSREKRVDPATGCESCHGPGSAHLKKKDCSTIYSLTKGSDPQRVTEICLQCHMRNRDKRLESKSMESLFGDVRDYPKGYEPGNGLMTYKTPAPFEWGHETKEFFKNGVGKKNRSQGNDFVKSIMYKRGITCANCHDPHMLDSTTTFPVGDALCKKCHKFGTAIGPHQKSLAAHTRHKADSKGSSCIECHMPRTGRHLGSSPVTVRTHVFGFITPGETRKYGVPNGCANCHRDKPPAWAQTALRSWGIADWSGL